MSPYLHLQALVTAAKAEKSTTVQRSYAQAAASVAKYTSEARVAKLVEEAVAMYTVPGQPALHCRPTPSATTNRTLQLLSAYPNRRHTVASSTPHKYIATCK